MADIAIISALYGSGYDKLKPPVKQRGIDAEWILVTDQKELIDEQDTIIQASPLYKYYNGGERWRIVYEPSDEIPVRAGKWPKLLPWEFTDAPASIWIDHSVQVRDPEFAVQAISYANPMAQFDHHLDCLYEEALNTKQYSKYDDEWEAIDGMCAKYKAAGHPPNWGLWTGTVIARQHTPIIKEMCTEWFNELDHWCHQDQISEPFVLRNFGIRPTFFPDKIVSNGWLSWGLHDKEHPVRSPKRNFVIRRQLAPWENDPKMMLAEGGRGV